MLFYVIYKTGYIVAFLLFDFDEFTEFRRFIPQTALFFGVILRHLRKPLVVDLSENIVLIKPSEQPVKLRNSPFVFAEQLFGFLDIFEVRS